MRPRSFTPASCSLFLLLACSDNAGPSVPPLILEIAGGNGQRPFVAGPTTQPLQVRVVTFTGNPWAGVPITFALEAGDARLGATEARTDTAGVASVALTIGEKAGPVVVTASGADLRGSPVTFALTATPDFSSPLIAAVSSDAIAGFVGHDFLFPVSVLVTDRFDNPIPDMQIDWSVRVGGGSVSWDRSNTDLRGIATAKWTAGPDTGVNRLLATVTTGVVAQFTGTAVLPGPGTIAVSAWGEPVQGIYLMQPDGSQFTLLPDQGSGSRNPLWSPHGARLAYNTTRFGGVEVAVMQPDGTGLVRATPMPEGAFAEVLGWSPDGSRILFVSDVDSDAGQLYVANADGSGVREAIRNTEGVVSADWSPDGTRIALGTGNPEAISIIAPDGSELTHLASGTDPHWSRDGSTIAFNSTRAEGGTQPKLMNPDGTGQVPFPGTAGALSLKFQSWSPDGTKALFTAVPIGQADDDEFYSINADGAGLVQITNDAVVTLGGSWGPSVSP